MRKPLPFPEMGLTINEYTLSPTLIEVKLVMIIAGKTITYN